MAYISSFEEHLKLNKVFGKKKCLRSHCSLYTKDIHGVTGKRNLSYQDIFREDRVSLESEGMTGDLIMSLNKKKWNET